MRQQQRLPQLIMCITLTSASGNNIPTFSSTMRELNLGSQLFSHNFICAKVKQPILGWDFLAENRLVENYAGRFLRQIQTDLFIPAVDNTTRRTSHINQVQIDQRVRKMLKNFPQVTKVSSSDYSKLQPQHGICPSPSSSPPNSSFSDTSSTPTASGPRQSTWQQYEIILPHAQRKISPSSWDY